MGHDNDSKVIQCLGGQWIYSVRSSRCEFSTVVQWDRQWHLWITGDAGSIPGPAQRWCSCAIAHNCGSDLILGPGTPCATGWSKKKKKVAEDGWCYFCKPSPGHGISLQFQNVFYRTGAPGQRRFCSQCHVDSISLWTSEPSHFWNHVLPKLLIRKHIDVISY